MEKNDTEFQYIIQFIKEHDEENWSVDITKKQLKALWTAYCFHKSLDVDTLSYDRALDQLWDVYPVNCAFKDYHAFDLYMGQDLC